MKRKRETGNMAMILIIAVLVVGLALGGVAVFLASKKKPAVEQVVTGPASPYDALSAGTSDRDLRYDTLNVQSGLDHEELNLKNTDSAVNDTPQTISDR